MAVRRSTIALGFAALLMSSTAARAAEGMWTLDNLPIDAIKQKYGFSPTPEWIQHVMHASARLTLGCSASFVSPDGLVMTNHHCANECLSDLSAGHANYMQDGFAPKDGSEPKCPGMELNQLQQITDVTKPMDDATKGKEGADFIHAQHATQASLEKACAAGDPAHTRCDVVTLYEGGRYALYRYRRFDDIRLVFAPDQAIAFFGGDPDNFNFPRYDLDLTFLRAYENGHPAHTAYFPFDPAGPKAGELVFVSGNPGSTSRDTTADQIALLHDQQLPLIDGIYQNLDGVLWEYSRQGPQQEKDAADQLFGVENTLKVFTGWQETLGKPDLLQKKRDQQKALLDWIGADPSRKQTYGDPFQAIAATLPAERALLPRFTMIEGQRRALGFDAPEFSFARILVRAAAERGKPNADRLPAFRDSNLPALQEALFSTAPIHPALDETTLAFSLTKLRQVLGVDDGFVQTALGKASPDQRAHALITGTKLGDVAVRKQLWDGGSSAIAASNDPMIVLARAVDPESRAVRKRWEDEVEAPQRKQAALIAQARFARDGTSIYPDATFTERLSYGSVKGWHELGAEVPPFTYFSGLYDRATGSPPFQLPKAWLDAKSRLDLKTPFDFATTNDIIGGNSGSPVIDKDAHAVGLIFDGNIHSIAGDFVYDASDNRAVAVDTAAILAALRGVYGENRIADELTGKAPSQRSSRD